MLHKMHSTLIDAVTSNKQNILFEIVQDHIKNERQI